MSGADKLGIIGESAVIGDSIAAEAAQAIAPTTMTAGPVSADSIDPRYNRPFVEIDEQRSTPFPHRYVHGGFTGTGARFSIYLPPKEQYEGRFFHNTYPMATTSDIGPFPIQFGVAIGDLGFTLDSGAYYLQTNLGGSDRAVPMADPAIGAYRVNAAAAKYSRKLAAEYYGDHRAWGYLFGGSGGSYQVMGAAENTSGVWDGFLPYVLGTPNSVPSMFTIRMHAMRVLRKRNKFPAVVDAISPGGSGDPYAELDDEESAALREATLLGYPLRGWWNHETLTSGYFYNVAPGVPKVDPSYVDDFWSKPGYLGADPQASIGAARFTFDTSVTRVIEGPDVPVGLANRLLELSETPDREFVNAHLVMLTGAAAGKSVPIARVTDRIVGFAIASSGEVLASIEAGDKARIDNSWPLALESYQRHQVSTPDLYGWNQYRGEDAEPIYPQRAILVGPLSASATAGSIPEGRVSGKVLVLQTLMDIDAMPWQADWYRSMVKKALGPAFDDNFVLWFIDNAQHDDPPTPAAHANTVSFGGALQQGLRDLSSWVERGVKPAETSYAVVDTQVTVPAGAQERGGIQPVVKLTANGGECANAAVGELVSFEAIVEVPPGAGKVVSAEWDFEGEGTYPALAPIGEPAALVSLSATHAFARPGTYFPVLRAASQRENAIATPYCRVQNLGRVRVMVK